MVLLIIMCSTDTSGQSMLLKYAFNFEIYKACDYAELFFKCSYDFLQIKSSIFRNLFVLVRVSHTVRIWPLL